MEKLNILITGPNGFLAKELSDYFSDKHNLVHRMRFDVRYERWVEHVLEHNEVDVVIHTATKGVNRHKDNTLQDLSDNLGMFDNLIKHRDKYKMLFCFCSGAAFDREKLIDNIKEEEIFNRRPDDYYGLSKNIIAREVFKHDGVFNFRLFGCFGRHEGSSRFLSSVWNSITSHKPIKINQNKEMDFFWAQDVGRVIEHYMENYGKVDLPKDINLTYQKKITLLRLAKAFTTVVAPGRDELLGLPDDIKGSPYTGSGGKLHSLNIRLSGLTGGFVNSYGGEIT